MDKVIAGHVVLWLVVLVHARQDRWPPASRSRSAARAACSPPRCSSARWPAWRSAPSPTTCSARRSARRRMYAVVAMGGVFAGAAQAPLTAIASVIEMTGNFSLTLPIMLASGIAAAVSKHLSYGSIYTTKLLRRGIDIERPRTATVLQTLTVADVMQPMPETVGRSHCTRTLPDGRTARAIDHRALGKPDRPRHRHPRASGAVRRRNPRAGAATTHPLRPRRTPGHLGRSRASRRLDHPRQRPAGPRPQHPALQPEHRARRDRRRLRCTQPHRRRAHSQRPSLRLRDRRGDRQPRLASTRATHRPAHPPRHLQNRCDHHRQRVRRGRGRHHAAARRTRHPARPNQLARIDLAQSRGRLNHRHLTPGSSADDAHTPTAARTTALIRGRVVRRPTRAPRRRWRAPSRREMPAARRLSPDDRRCA